MIQAHESLQFLKGVGPRRAEELRRQGLETVEDLLYQMPFRYEDRRSFATIRELERCQETRTLSVSIESSRLIHTRRRGFKIFEAWVSDSSGSIRAVWFNQPYLQRIIVSGRRAVLYGRVTYDRSNRTVLENPEYEILDDEDAEQVHTGRVVPVYRRTAELGSKAIRRLMFRALNDLDAASLPALVPEEIRTKLDLPGRLDALRAVHFPPDDARLEELDERATPSHTALAFEEIFLLQLGLALRRHESRVASRRITYDEPDPLRTRLAGELPFELTAAQSRVLAEIGADLSSPHPMNRLLQGDVGSGKTIVALLTLLVAVENGWQAALMAPTEILADQHFRTISRLLADHPGFRAGLGLEGAGAPEGLELLTGSLRAAARRRTLERIASGRAKLVVGTHALFQAGVEFERLALVVVDEQHRFGVLQRAGLAEKGRHPDVLVMTATPIPRSLALTLYGDLDLSTIDELPPGRTPIRTVVRGEDKREKVYRGVRGEIGSGRQVYVVVPLVEETEKSDLKAAEDFAAHLRSEVFPDLNIGMLHGRMKGPEKDETMRAFAAGKLQLLVATTVVEVGVDVPNATVMVVEHAERFGLSQLHQLRGRVGRGAARSYCVLMAGGDHGTDARERLKVMEETNDGFKIAERDLELRGPGVVFGTQQHGLSDLMFLALVLRSPWLLDAAREEARLWVTRDEGCRRDARSLLRSLTGRWTGRLDLARIG
jgi:ATP-dependent DNA helicase RecG